MLRVFRTSGASMWPTYTDRSILVTLRVPRRLLSAGRVVVYRVPGGEFIVKRIADVLGDDRLRLASDNPATTSIYCEGTVPAAGVVGLVVLAFRRGRPERG
ncbi:MAG: S24/S26 family peptidase [Pseudomonadota bacterium]